MIPRPAALTAVALLALAPAAAAAFDIVPFAELCGATIDHPTAVPRTEQQVNPAGGGGVVTIRDRASLLISGATVSVHGDLRFVLVNGGALEVRWSGLGASTGLVVDGTGHWRRHGVRPVAVVLLE